MIPVHFTAQSLWCDGQKLGMRRKVSGGACMMDVDGDGIYDLVLMQSGESAVRVLRSHGDGSFEPFRRRRCWVEGQRVMRSPARWATLTTTVLPISPLRSTTDLVLFRNLGQRAF
jgi:hypothetical protein